MSRLIYVNLYNLYKTPTYTKRCTRGSPPTYFIKKFLVKEEVTTTKRTDGSSPDQM